MNMSNETRHAGAAGLGDNAFPGRNSGSEITQTQDVNQAKIETLRAEIVATASPMIASLNAVIAMVEIPDDAGALHGLRIAKVYWRACQSVAAELACLRQGEGQ